MAVNIAVLQYYIDQCEANIPQGMGLNTYIKPCFFIYDQNPETCTIRIEDKTTQVAFYDNQTDVHTVTIRIFDTEGLLCFEGPMNPFGTFSFDLPGYGEYKVEIDIRYTIFYIDGSEIIEHTFQQVLMYCITCDICGDYHNSIVQDIKERISCTQVEIGKRKCVGRKWDNLQENIYALNNFLFALCNFSFNESEYDMISGAVKGIKKVC